MSQSSVTNRGLLIKELYQQILLIIGAVVVLVGLFASLLLSGYFNVQMTESWSWPFWAGIVLTIAVSLFQGHIWKLRSMVWEHPATQDVKLVLVGLIISLAVLAGVFSVYSSTVAFMVWGMPSWAALPVSMVIDTIPEPLLIPMILIVWQLCKDLVVIIQTMRALPNGGAKGQMRSVGARRREEADAA